MREYFYNLDTLDPLFHAIVGSRLRQLQQQQGMERATIADLTDEDEVEILRRYSVALFKEYRALRSVFIENMQVCSSSVKLKFNSN
jgi:hypothetical protein